MRRQDSGALRRSWTTGACAAAGASAAFAALLTGRFSDPFDYPCREAARRVTRPGPSPAVSRRSTRHRVP